MISRDAWYRQMPGLMLLSEEKKVLSRVSKGHHGEIVLQIGGPDDARLTETLKTARVVFLDSLCRTHHEKPYIQSSLTALPIASESVDTVLVMHALELSDAPEMVLAEVHRILKPGGQVIVCCFNRWSIWNLLHHAGRKKVFPKAGRCRSLGSIKKWLYALDAEIVVQQTVCFRPPLLSREGIQKWLFLETWGQMIAPYFGAAVMVVATKKVVDMTPLIDLEWVREMALSQQVVMSPTSTRSFFKLGE